MVKLDRRWALFTHWPRRLCKASSQYEFFTKEWQAAGHRADDWSWHHTQSWGCENRKITTNPGFLAAVNLCLGMNRCLRHPEPRGAESLQF